MKRILISILLLSGMISMASAELGLNLGVSAQVGSMETSGKEVNSTTSLTETSDVHEALFATGGYFIEKDLAFLPGFLGRVGSRVHLGYDNIVHDLDMGSQSNVRTNISPLDDDADPNQVHTLNAEVTGFNTKYVTLNIFPWLYVKGGDVSVDVSSKFVGTSTSTYPTTHKLDGSMVGIGIENTSENGLFFRLEFNDYDIDGKAVANTGTDSKFTATLNDVSGTTGRISIGKAF